MYFSALVLFHPKPFIRICMILYELKILFYIDAVLATLILFLMSKCAISASFLIIYPFSGELYPTQLRGIGIGISAYIGGLGLIIIPFITYLVNIHFISCVTFSLS